MLYAQMPAGILRRRFLRGDTTRRLDLLLLAEKAHLADPDHGHADSELTMRLPIHSAICGTSESPSEWPPCE